MGSKVSNHSPSASKSFLKDLPKPEKEKVLMTERKTGGKTVLIDLGDVRTPCFSFSHVLVVHHLARRLGDK